MEEGEKGRVEYSGADASDFNSSGVRYHHRHLTCSTGFFHRLQVVSDLILSGPNILVKQPENIVKQILQISE